MATLREIAFPLAAYPSGTREFPLSGGGRPIPDTAQELYFEFARCTDATPTVWPNASTGLQYAQEVSFDGGVTWIGAGGFSAAGGVHTLRNGTQATLSTLRVGLPAGTGRLWRCQVTITNGPLRTTGSVELRD